MNTAKYDFSPLEKDITTKQALTIIFSDSQPNLVRNIVGSYILFLFLFAYFVISPWIHKIMILVVIPIGVWGLISSTKTRYKIDAFISRNSLTALSGQKISDSHKGFIFNVGNSRHYNGIGFNDSVLSEIGNQTYTIGSGKNKQHHNFGVIRLKLSRKLPHMVLDSTKNNDFGENLAKSFRSNQKLSLEGDFDKYFTLYTPKQYERDALYVFTPELMSILVDQLSLYDIEIIDDDLYLYNPTPFVLSDGNQLKSLIVFANKIISEFRDNTDLYKDDRPISGESGLVAEQGQRLYKKPITAKKILTIIISIFLLIFFSINLIGTIYSIIQST